ncbi:MAG: hypothetical protein AAF639_35955 [Chloroflexota bacterium]
MTVYWRLKYAQSVVSTLYQLREKGHELHNTIKAMKFQQEPWDDAQPVPHRPRRYELTFGHYILGFEVSSEDEDAEPTLRILYIDQIKVY